MARPVRKGLGYFPRDTDYYDDFKIVDLMYEHGPLGQTVYDVILTLIYKSGYYVELPVDKMVQVIIRTIGNRWADKDSVMQIIMYCGEIGLLDKGLLVRNVFTSVGIQRRYAEIKARNRVEKTEFWLLDKNDKTAVSNTITGVIAAETPVIAAETLVIASEITQKKRKEKKSKIKDNICDDGSSQGERPKSPDYEAVVNLFNGTCIGLPSIRYLTDKRKKAIRDAAKRVEEYGGWKKLFKAVQDSDFLTGRNGAWSGCGFDWIMKPSNLTKIMEGNYRNKDDATGQPPRSYDIDQMERQLWE